MEAQKTLNQPEKATNRKLKLLLVADTYYPKVDGTLKFMEEFLKRSQQEFAISLLVPLLEKQGGKHVTYVPTYKKITISGYPSIRLSFSTIKIVKKAIREADIIFIQGPALLSYLSIYFSKKAGKRTIFYTHTIAWELFEKFFPPLVNRIFFNLIKRLSIFFYNRSDVILVPYRKLREELQHEGVKTRIIVARLGVDIARFSPPADKRLSKQNVGIASDKFVIGYVGRISKEKNAEVLLKAFKKLKQQEDVHLLLVGDGPEDQVQPFREIPNCTITGFVPDVQKYLKAMDLFVMPSLTETTSLATLEAMATGLPVIATKVGFIKSYIVKDHNGTFFPRNSAGMLAMKIEKQRKDSELRQKLGRNARKTVAYGFSWERSINKIKRLLKEAYNRKE